jgi:hypothetical protein
MLLICTTITEDESTPDYRHLGMPFLDTLRLPVRFGLENPGEFSACTAAAPKPASAVPLTAFLTGHPKSLTTTNHSKKAKAPTYLPPAHTRRPVHHSRSSMHARSRCPVMARLLQLAYMTA